MTIDEQITATEADIARASVARRVRDGTKDVERQDLAALERHLAYLLRRKAAVAGRQTTTLIEISDE